ncbi:MAG: 3-hydroxyacyl-CoA dehydrogenase family protein [Clostridiales Family XIII bacterium]|jgi:carnitine 3-dehydrogenase|nr:3-hydroxyacyl-CoA dehydrogenase family protein [Clostridiales Family XIII bacterium]
MEKKKIAFVGSGIIGSGLAVNALTHGYPVTLQTRSRVEKMKSRVAHILEILVENEVCSQAEAAVAAARATYTTSLEDAATGAFFVQESGPENPDVKKALYRQIESVCDADTIIASSTTALMPSLLQEGATHPERILVGHPFHPSYLLPLVEICGGAQTDPSVTAGAKAFYESIGKLALLCGKEISGYIVNRVNWAALEEAKKTVLDGVCSVEDIDKAIMFGPGLRMAVLGQMLTISLGIEGGFRGGAAKYGKEPSPDDELLARGVEEEIAKRPEALGNTEETVRDFRDKAIIRILRLQNML